jgi:hypothetical protein
MMVGEKVDPIYLKIMKGEELTFIFPSPPQLKELPRPKREGVVTVGEKVPDFALRGLDGKAVKLSQLQKGGRRTKQGVVVLSFWCSTCSSCRRPRVRLGGDDRHDVGRLASAFGRHSDGIRTAFGPPARVARAASTRTPTPACRKCTEPSANTKLAPPGWKL